MMGMMERPNKQVNWNFRLKLIWLEIIIGIGKTMRRRSVMTLKTPIVIS